MAVVAGTRDDWVEGVLTAEDMQRRLATHGAIALEA